jgi:N-acetyl-gamma-glutamyl-phosphate reductase
MAHTKIRVGVVGASGYTGGELLRLLASHPHAEIALVTAEKHAGKVVAEVFPSLTGAVGNLKLEKLDDPAAARSRCDFMFTALPHHASAEMGARLLAGGLPVVDLSADFRFESLPVYEAWYGNHPHPELLAKAVYGLPELHRKKIKGAKLVANPGCYVTSAILALAPFLKHGLIEPVDILDDAKSGMSGAGRSASEDMLYAEVNEGLRPYKAANHRHQPEIEKELSAVAGVGVVVTFVPHLLPINRGILSTLYCKPTHKMTTAHAHEALRTFYEGEPFVRVLPAGKLPNPAHIKGSNFCDLGVHFDERQNRLIVFSALDNLVKGAAGQAVQNMNLMLGFAETAGLAGYPVFP